MHIKPLSSLVSSSIFLGHGVLFCLLYYFIFPILIKSGWYFWHAFNLVTITGFVPMFVTGYVMLKSENIDLSWHWLKARLRLKRLNKQDFVLIFVGLVTTIPLYIILLFSARWFFAQVGALPLWYEDPDLPIGGLYSLIFWRLVLVIINVVAEEFLWRGVILPRQELNKSRRTWVIHGVQWLSFHCWKPWEWLMLLPTCLYYSWLSQKQQSMTPALILHFIFNSLGLVILTMAVVS